MEKIVFVTTASFTVKVYLYPHIRAMSEHFDITIVSDGDAEYFQDILSSNISFVPITINRKINIISDIKALFFLYRLFRKEKFVSAHSIMPKSGLLGMSIAFLTKTKIRIHTFTGQPWVTMKPPLRWILMGMDKLVGYFSTAVLADSQSQLQFLLDRNIIDQNKSKVLGAGSICGVNMKRFQQNAASRAKLRAKLKFNVDDVVFLYLGRLTKEKGLIDLAFAFKEVRHSCSSVKLVYVGPEEDAIVEETRTILGDDFGA
jgi:glycosyltransferase involved in cell wall biosynthesis